MGLLIKSIKSGCVVRIVQDSIIDVINVDQMYKKL